MRTWDRNLPQRQAKGNCSLLQINKAVGLKVTLGGHQVYIPMFKQNGTKIKPTFPTHFKDLQGIKQTIPQSSLGVVLIPGINVKVWCLRHLWTHWFSLFLLLYLFHLDEVWFLVTRSFTNLLSSSHIHLRVSSRSVLMIIWHDCMNSLFFYMWFFYRKTWLKILNANLFWSGTV